MAKRIPLHRVTPGLNTVSDPAELIHDPATGQVELAVAVNVDISRTGKRIASRKGRDLLESGEFHSGFCDGGDALCVREYPEWASLYLVDPTSGSLTGIRSGLSKHRPMTYCQVNDQIYYSNGNENGVYQNGASTAWTRGTYVGWESDKELYDAPVADIITVMGGFMLLAVGPVIWFSQEFDYSAYNLANRHLDLVDDVTMLKPVTDGCWIGTTQETIFMAGTNPSQWQVSLRMPYSVHRRAQSTKTVRGEKLGIQGLQGAGYLWLGSAGICWGGPMMQHVALTDRKINPDDLRGYSGTCQIVGNRVIAIVDP